MNYNPSSKPYRPLNYDPALDGLRGIAIIAVVLYHNFSYMPLFSMGWLGVDLFFVLSGFLITRILLDTINNKSYFRNFYAKRALRIVPLYFLSLIIFLHILPLLISINGITYYQVNQWYFYLFIQNWLLSFYFPGETTSTILQHYWSLAVEEQYYLVWPIIIYVARKHITLIRFLIFVIISINIVRFTLLTVRIENFPYALLYWFTRIDGLCAGSLLALLITHPSKKKYLITAISITAFVNLAFLLILPSQFLSTVYLGVAGFTTFSILFATLIYYVITPTFKPIRNIFETKILKGLGKISFGLYIFHHPIHLLLKNYISNFTTNYGLSKFNGDLLTSIVTTAIGILLSILSYNYFEKYFLKLKKHFANMGNN